MVRLIRSLNTIPTTSITYPAPLKFNHNNMDVNEWIMDMDQYINLNNVRGNKKHIFWAFMDTATREMIQEETLSDNDDAAADEI